MRRAAALLLLLLALPPSAYAADPVLEIDDDGTAVVHGDAPAPVRRAVAAANRITHTPYIWGGGHGRFTDDGYDCSGSVSYVLHAAGLLGRTRTSRLFTTYGTPGEGRYMTVHARNGHVFMTILGARFDTEGMDLADTRWQWDMDPRWFAGLRPRHPPGL